MIILDFKTHSSQHIGLKRSFAQTTFVKSEVFLSQGMSWNQSDLFNVKKVAVNT
jgi:hypothetical protein